jgi:hypothetical protein
MIHFNALRKLARSLYWQTIYSRSKEHATIGIFQNTIDFTPLQINFLQWLEVYHSLEIDLSMKKEYLTREVIEDDILCDAYLHWRSLTAGKSGKELEDIKKLDEHADGAVVFKTKHTR